jgi:hypothetical protein
LGSCFQCCTQFAPKSATQYNEFTQGHHGLQKDDERRQAGLEGCFAAGEDSPAARGDK